MELLCFNGYQGTVETSIADGILHGKILFIMDLVTFEAETLPQLRLEFEAAVLDYLATCAAVGKRPEKPFSGQFNVRVSEELHKRALLKALGDNTSLNAVVVAALQAHLAQDQRPSMTRHLVTVPPGLQRIA